MKGSREQLEAVCLKNYKFELEENLIDGMSSEEQYKLVRESLRIFLRQGKAEFPLLLKHFGIDLKTGQRLMNYLEHKGYIGPERPDRSRNVLITKSRFEEYFGENVTSYMHLEEQPFEAILSGKKRVELRLNDEKRRTLKVGDRVEFICLERSIRVEVTDLSYEKKFSNYDIATLFAAGLQDVKAGEIDDYMRRYYGKKEVAKYGTIAIHFEKIASY